MRFLDQVCSAPAEKDPSRDQRLRGPARTLVVSGQRALVDTVVLALDRAHYNLRVASTSEEAMAAVADWRPHILILDVDFDGNAGLQCFGAAVLNGGRFPVIALTRRADVESRLSAFQQGVDDVLTLPFSPKELAARVMAVMRRMYHDAAVFCPLLRVGDLEIDILNRRVRTGDSELHFTSLELSLLYLLAASAGRLLTRDDILESLWGADYVAESNVVDRHIRNLRVKLQNHSPWTRYIITVPGRGYRFLPQSSGAV